MAIIINSVLVRFPTQQSFAANVRQEHLTIARRFVNTVAAQVKVGEGVASLTATPDPCYRYLQVTIPDLTDRIIAQGKALVRAIEALGTIQPSSPFERALARLPMAAYKRRLRGIVEIAPAWVSEEILSASEHIGDRWAMVWMPAQCFDFYPEWQHTMCV